MSALYNELEPFAVTWLRNLIAGGHIADGVVDDRSICDLAPADVAGPGQRHFFAGIACWSLALRLAGVPDDADVWTGSCPCQPFSGAGKRLGVADDRHLWPVWFELVRECRPPVIFGEQVAGKAGRLWLSGVRADLEREGYAVGAADLAAASVGAPHIRQRIFFGAYRLADGDRTRLLVERRGRLLHGERPAHGNDADRRGADDRLADHGGDGRQDRVLPGPASGATRGGGAGDGLGDDAGPRRGGRQDSRASGGDAGGGAEAERGRPGWLLKPERAGDDGRLGDAGVHGARQHARELPGDESQREVGATYSDHAPRVAGPTLPGAWGDAEWILCSDGCARPAQPGAFPLVDGTPGRVGRLRAYGGAIVPQVAAAFIASFLEAMTV